MEKKQNGLGIAGFILSLIGCTSVLGVILSIVALITGKGKKNGLAIAGLIIGLIWCGFGALFMAGAFAVSEENSAKITSTESGKEETVKADTDSNNRVKVGETFTKDKLSVTLLSVEDNYSEQYNEPKEGYKIFKATFKCENNADYEQYVSIYDFKCYADNTSCEEKYLGDSSFINENLATGRNVTYDVFFEVPENAKSIELEYSNNVWDSKAAAIFVISE